MYYSTIGVLAILILSIENYDILFRRVEGDVRPDFKIFRRLLFTILIYYVTDVFWGIFEDRKLVTALFVDTTLYFVAMAVGVLFWTKYAVAYLDEKNAFGKFLVIAGRVLFATVVISVAVNIFTPILFRIDDQALYSAYAIRYVVLISQIVLLLLVSAYSFLSMRKKTRIKAKKYRTIALFGFITAVFLTVQIWFPYLPLYSVAYMLGTCLLRTFIVNDEKDEYKNKLAQAAKREQLQREELISARILAYKDALTGVKSKLAYAESEEKRDEEIRLGRAPDFALAVFDVNELKETNDELGHEKGDQLLISACRMICEHFQHSPVFRIGGDEFAVMLERSDYENRRELRESFDRMMENSKENDRPIIAMGMADYEASRDSSLHDVFVRADSQMYERKRVLKAQSESRR